MRFLRFTITGFLFTGLVLAAAAQETSASFSGLTLILPEPAPDEQAPPEPALPEPVLPEPALPEAPDEAPTNDSDEPPATAAILGPLGPDSQWFDPGESTRTGALPTGGGFRGDDPDSEAESGTPVTPEVPAAPVRVVSMPPEGWTPQWPTVARDGGGVVAERQVIAYYGHPNSTRMGILGESPIAEMAADLLSRAAEYDAINGPIGVAPAFHIIYGTVWEDANIGILREPKLLEYIEYAQENGIIVFLDHQIGRFTVAEAIDSMLPYLAYPHVHLAIDPEWATTAPGQVIGEIDAAELNHAQQMISDYLVANGIAEPKMLVVHQFNWRMITNRELVRTDYPNVQLIHNADGFGPPAMKIVSWQANVQAANMPLKGFKLFYPKSWRDGGYDDPLLSPIEVMQLEPVPVYIQYQ